MKRTAALFLLAACSGLPADPKPGVVSLAVTSPKPGAEIADTTITVTGSVATTNPDYGKLRASVNGTAVDLSGDGAFTAQVPAVVGVNHLVVDASDGLSAPARQQLDVLWAPDWLPPATGTTTFAVPDALDLYLGQRFFDGRQLGTTLDMSTDPVVAHDLAAALELILWNIDLASLLSGGIHAGTGNSTLDINIPAATPAEITVDTVIAGPSELDLAIDLNGVFLSTTGQFTYGNRTLQLAGGISADMHASARMVLSVNSDGTIGVDVQDVTATVGPLVPAFTGPDADTLDGFIRVGNNDFRLLVENIIQQQLIPTFTNKIPPLLQQLLGATDKLLNNVSFTLDAKLGTPVMLTLNGAISALDVTPGPAFAESPGHITNRQTVTITTASAPIHSDSRGAIRVAATPVLPSTATTALGITLSQDFLNAVLHALWNSGLLEGNASVGGFSAGVSAKLAPVVIPVPDNTTCDVDGIRCDLLVQLGQIQVDLPDFNQSFAISATAGARVVVAGNTVSLSISQDPTVLVWETSAVPGRLSTDAVHDLVTKAVWPQLFGAIGNNLHITLPIPDLASLGLSQLSPNLANAQLQLDVQQRASVTAGYLGLNADVALQTPHP
ncbi:MAG: hypothetical protein JO257_30575 [Deltaproteobacteria bacterium]|nr:hypothetical protein [Deltaproteobacteria bacterium]